MGGIIRSEASAAIDAAVRALAFSHWFGISGARAFVLSELYEARGRHVSPDALAAAASVTRTAIIVRICRLREAIDSEAIDSEPGGGYWLTEVGIAECRKAILMFKDSLDRPGDVKEAAE